jgi:ATP-dependent RNA helicase RhlE
MLQLLNNNTRVKGNRARALILTPTRELAAQIQDSIQTYGRYLQLRSTVVFGGVNINPQMMMLRKGVDILVATPGRLLDLYQQNAIRFNDIEILVLDEADRMLDMGFIRDIKKIMALLPKLRQNLLFSATFPSEIRQLAKTVMNNPVEIDVSPPNSTLDAIAQKVYPVDKGRKAELLSHLVRTGNWNQVLVFSRTKHGADKLVKQLTRDKINAVAIHGNKSQPQRTKALSDFKQYKIQVLVATDIASRGLDIDQLPHVINFDLPHVPEDYIHRIGRTGRAGATGTAISLVSLDEIKQLRDIERLIKRSIEREDVEGFMPVCTIPVTNPDKPAGSKPRHKPGGRINNLKPSRRLGRHNQLSGQPAA